MLHRSLHIQMSVSIFQNINMHTDNTLFQKCKVTVCSRVH